MIVALVGLLFTGCSNSDISAPNDAEDIDVKALVQDYSSGTATGESASIDSHQLLVKEKGGKEVVYQLPEDEFFVSIAPYVERTHE